MQTLYELTSAYQQLLELAEDPDTDPGVLQDTMEGLEGEIEEKADSYAVVMNQLEADEEQIDKEIKRLTERKKSLAANRSRMKASLFDAMNATGKKKFKTALFSFSIKKSPAAVVMEVDDWKLVPEEYLRRKDPEVDKAKIKSAIQLGIDLSGVAHLEQAERLDIR